MNIEKTNLAGDSVAPGHPVLYGCVIFAGAVLFLWFCWPALFKGMINVGNTCGMLASTALMLYGIRHQRIHQLLTQLWQKKPMRVCFLLILVLAFVGIGLMIAASAVMIGAASKQIPENTPAVVLGCAVKGSRPSRILQERIDAAYAYLQENPQAVCILSGGQGKGEDISEAACMYRELIHAGIDADRLYQEDQSVNTRQNLEYSGSLLRNLETYEAVTVISSEFHLYRGRWWAKKQGFLSYGYAAHTDWKYLPTMFLREVIAVVHLWLVQ